MDKTIDLAKYYDHLVKVNNLDKEQAEDLRIYLDGLIGLINKFDDQITDFYKNDKNISYFYKVMTGKDLGGSSGK